MTSRLQNNADTAEEDEHSHRRRTYENDDDEDDWMVAGQCDSAKTLLTLLQCLVYNQSSLSGSLDASTGRRKNANAILLVTIYCSRHNLQFHTMGSAKQIQASVEIPASFFNSYQLQTAPTATATSAANGHPEDDDDTLEEVSENNDCKSCRIDVGSHTIQIILFWFICV